MGESIKALLIPFLTLSLVLYDESRIALFSGDAGLVTRQDRVSITWQYG